MSNYKEHRLNIEEHVTIYDIAHLDIINVDEKIDKYDQYRQSQQWDRQNAVDGDLLSYPQIFQGVAILVYHNNYLFILSAT